LTVELERQGEMLLARIPEDEMVDDGDWNKMLRRCQRRMACQAATKVHRNHGRFTARLRMPAHATFYGPP
jgi:hypothetical protein